MRIQDPDINGMPILICYLHSPSYYSSFNQVLTTLSLLLLVFQISNVLKLELLIYSVVKNIIIILPNSRFANLLIKSDGCVVSFLYLYSSFSLSLVVTQGLRSSSCRVFSPMKMTEAPRSDHNSCDEMFVNYLARKNVVLPKSGVLRAVEELLQEPKQRSVGKKTARTTVSLCADRSLVQLAFNRYSNMTKNDVSLLPVFREMRHCLLIGDWDNHKELLLTLLRSPNINERYIAFIIRSCFVLLFNHPNRTAELVDNFVTSCLRIKDPSKKIKYLQDCFLLRGKTVLDCVLNDNRLDDEENVEEEMVFYSDCSISD